MNKAPAWRLVLDTNVVLDLLHFLDATALPIRRAIEARRAQCYASENTLSEFRRVLAYPEFALVTPVQADLLILYQSWINDIPDEAYHAKQPRCADPDDQMFLQLAAAVHADFLVSKDKALLALKHRVQDFRILTPSELAGLL